MLGSTGEAIFSHPELALAGGAEVLDAIAQDTPHQFTQDRLCCCSIKDVRSLVYSPPSLAQQTVVALR
ncbi:hypothetical protein RRG08_049751 [Elysia crispata]|uniref:Uncharacterized protein n=1 Tax=Elysia crispata TaxID=231223 RepID=A0AAE1DEA8_9GAST|nr:hypothetical protein RRG08_049751 [Elysia crispata]